MTHLEIPNNIFNCRNGNELSEMEILPMIASVLDTSIDFPFGDISLLWFSDYDKRYDTTDYYWGIT